MMKSLLRLLLLLCLAFVFVTCSEDDKDPSDMVQDSAEDTTEDNAEDSVEPEDTVEDEGGEPGEFGFVYRVPGAHMLDCGTDDLFQDKDWICTFDYEGSTGHVYVQATPSTCGTDMSVIPIPYYYQEDVRGWISLDGEVSELENVDYDYGGGHVNDYFSFDHQSRHFVYDHSSFGFGWRKCQPMDCARVSEVDGDIIEDGCTMDRTLPVVCQPIKEDGSFDSLVDTFEPCAGDPNYE